MKMRILLVAVVATSLFLISCSKKVKENGYTFKTSIDDLYCWNNSIQCVKKEKGHSGDYVSFVDSITPYSVTYCKIIKELPIPTLKKATIQAWVKVTSLPTKIALVTTIETKDTALFYLALPINPKINKINEWCLIKENINIPALNLPADAFTKIYFYSPNKDAALIDDIEISFE